MWFAQARIFSATVAFVAALAWFTGTHHCLLGIIARPHSTAVSSCHCTDPAKDSGPCTENHSRMLACCQGLLSPSCELAHAKIRFAPVLLRNEWVADCPLLSMRAAQSTFLSSEFDTGPPGESSFVGIVLKRSLRENAPPLAS
jgi:hypothetical protein